MKFVRRLSPALPAPRPVPGGIPRGGGDTHQAATAEEKRRSAAAPSGSRAAAAAGSPAASRRQIPLDALPSAFAKHRLGKKHPQALPGGRSEGSGGWQCRRCGGGQGFACGSRRCSIPPGRGRGSAGCRRPPERGCLAPPVINLAVPWLFRHLPNPVPFFSCAVIANICRPSPSRAEFGKAEQWQQLFHFASGQRFLFSLHLPFCVQFMFLGWFFGFWCLFFFFFPLPCDPAIC